MSRSVFIHRDFRCMRCSGDPAQATKHFRIAYWSGAPTFAGKPLTPTLRDLTCPFCSANSAWFESWPRVCSNFILPLRDDLRPVVFRRVDEHGREHYRYPAHNEAAPRPGEQTVDFPTLRSMTSFLKEQHPNHAQWQVPLNDILDYDESNIDTPAFDQTDPGVVEDAAAIDEQLLADDDFGVLDTPPDPSTVKMTLLGSS